MCLRYLGDRHRLGMGLTVIASFGQVFQYAAGAMGFLASALSGEAQTAFNGKGDGMFGDATDTAAQQKAIALVKITAVDLVAGHSPSVLRLLPRVSACGSNRRPYHLRGD